MGGTTENPYAGQGPVLLDIGGDVGALVVVMPPRTDGLEVELRPAGATAAGPPAHHSHDHSHDHPADAAQDSSPGRPAYPHVGVVARPDGAGVVHSLVYPSVTEGDYELYPLPDGPVVMTASVVGGQVTRNRWPG